MPWSQPFGKDDTIGCYIDTERCSVSFAKNGEGEGEREREFMTSSCGAGKFLGKAFDIPKRLHGDTFFAAVTLKVRRSIGATVLECDSCLLSECRDEV